jgi:AcrR family transcriptional regulator
MPKTKAQNELIRQKAKEKILSAALDIFSRYGYHGSTIHMIARHARISKGLAYNYFFSKKEIMEFLLQKHIDRIKQVLVMESSGTPKERFERVISEFCTIIVENERICRLIFSIILQPDIQKSFGKKNEFESEMLDYILPHFQKIMKNIGCDEKKCTAEHVRIVIYGLIFYYLWEKDEAALRTSANDLLNVFFK